MVSGGAPDTLPRERSRESHYGHESEPSEGRFVSFLARNSKEGNLECLSHVFARCLSLFPSGEEFRSDVVSSACESSPGIEEAPRELRSGPPYAARIPITYVLVSPRVFSLPIDNESRRVSYVIGTRRKKPHSRPTGAILFEEVSGTMQSNPTCCSCCAYLGTVQAQTGTCDRAWSSLGTYLLLSR